jgi:hypothetical protein
MSCITERILPPFSSASLPILQNFVEDRSTQLVLGTFIGTFTYALLVQWAVRSAEAAGEAFVPALAMSVAVVLVVASVCLLIYFIDHLVHFIRASVGEIEGRRDHVISHAPADETGSDPGRGAQRLRTRDRRGLRCARLRENMRVEHESRAERAATVPRPGETPSSWRERVVLGALLGIRAEAERPARREDGTGGLGRLAGGALFGALYAVAEQLLPLQAFGAPASMRAGRKPVPTTASRELYLGASALSFSVVADSGIEHYRGGFYNPAMYVAPTVSALTLAASLRDAARSRFPRGRSRQVLYGAAALTGLVGTSFHLYNVSKREGGWNWLNLFYGAPLAAPMGITFAGLFGLSAASVSRAARRREAPRLLGRPAGPVLGLAAAAGLLGTAAEAGLLHFRGAFQDPFMYIPVTVPPLAALALGAAALHPDGAPRALARSLLWTSAAAGFAGMGFHGWGIHRNMGGWRNWTQMIQQGPPLPAPPSFTGMALAGLAALELMKGDAHA